MGKFKQLLWLTIFLAKKYTKGFQIGARSKEIIKKRISASQICGQNFFKSVLKRPMGSFLH